MVELIKCFSFLFLLVLFCFLLLFCFFNNFTSFNLLNFHYKQNMPTITCCIHKCITICNPCLWLSSALDFKEIERVLALLCRGLETDPGFSNVVCSEFGMCFVPKSDETYVFPLAMLFTGFYQNIPCSFCFLFNFGVNSSMLLY